MAHIKSEVIKQIIARKFNVKVIIKKFKVGDLALRRVEKHSTDGKLAPNSDDSFRVYESLRNGVYRLVKLSRQEIPYIWNVIKLRRYYS